MDVGTQDSPPAPTVGARAKMTAMEDGNVENAGAFFDPKRHPEHKKGSNRVATPAILTGDYTVMRHEVSNEINH